MLISIVEWFVPAAQWQFNSNDSSDSRNFMNSWV